MKFIFRVQLELLKSEGLGTEIGRGACIPRPILKQPIENPVVCRDPDILRIRSIIAMSSYVRVAARTYVVRLKIQEAE